MEERSRKLVAIIFIIVFVIILIGSFRKVYLNHINRSYKVIEEKIVYAAKKCYLEEKCTDDKTTIKELINLGYLSSIPVDPISKENIDENIEVVIKDNNYIVDIKN